MLLDGAYGLRIYDEVTNLGGPVLPQYLRRGSG